MEDIEKFDKVKTKVLKYVLYKKRTEFEVRQKFADTNRDILGSIIEYLKEEKYIDDNNYIKKAVNEYMNLKNMSIKEIEYKLIQKGINKEVINDYISKNEEVLLQYDKTSAKKIIEKKNILDKQEIINYLHTKGYLEETINSIFGS